MREFDIIVYGATGFTGQLVTRYLSEQYAGVKLAIAGRNKNKLENMLAKDSIKADVIVADSNDEASLLAMVKRTKCVISLVGPYLLHGSLLVACCCKTGCHYLDLTGETPFAANMIQAHSRSAIEKSLIVHSAGFDSIPGDLCVFLAVQRLKELKPDVKVGKVLSSYRVKGGPSGGTLATVLNMLVEESEVQAINRNPFALSPIPGNHKVTPFLSQSVTFAGKKSHGAFFVMGPGNTALIRRTWGLFEAGDANSRFFSYGPYFQIEECIETKGRISAVLTSLGIYIAFGILMFFAPARALLRRFGPSPGEGPSIEEQINGNFTCTTVAKSVDEKTEVQVVMKGRGDPGYFLTSKMISEAAMCIVKDYDSLPPMARNGGFLTPAAAFGNVLADRLEATGFFTISKS